MLPSKNILPNNQVQPANQKFFRPYKPLLQPGQKPAPEPPKFRPYDSGSDSDLPDSDIESDSGTDVSTNTTDSSSIVSEKGANFVKLATNLQLNQASGPAFPTNRDQLTYGVNRVNKGVGYSQYESAFNIDILQASKAWDLSGVSQWKDQEGPKQPITSIVMLNSRDRDRNVYPQPTNLTLRLPRVYQNITSMQVVQMKLLSSFLYFRIDKNNISITINEFGRINYNYLNEAVGVLNITKRIREGSYNINTLITELTIQLNTPPPFYDYPGGFNQFVPLFVSTGDFGLAFNFPGDYWFDSLNRTYTAAPTRNFIITQYWQTPTLGFTPNLNQTKVAYYYPVLKELFLDPRFGTTGYILNTNIPNPQDLSGETLSDRVIYYFTGVNDPVIQSLIDLNVTVLDQYRSSLTFRQSLINRYVVSYETFNNRIYITATSLNTSLVNLLNTQYAIFFAQQLSAFGLTQAQYNLLVAANNALLSIVNSMYDYIQTQFALYFGVNFNTYAASYFTNPNYYILIQNALDATNVSSNYDINVITAGNTPITQNILELLRTDPPRLWPNMSNLSGSPFGYNINLGDSNQAPYLGQSNTPYVITSCNFDSNRSFINGQGDVFIDLSRRASDILTPIQAGKYTVFRFRSLYRQTLQVETLPRPTIYRYPAYNQANFNLQIRTFFDNSYSFVYNANNSNMDNVPQSNLALIPGFSNYAGAGSNFGIGFAASAALWTSNLSIDVLSNQYNFTFIAPKPATATSIAQTYTANLTIVNQPSSANLPSDLLLFLYHDRGGFMADLSGNARQEKPLHYNQTIAATTSQASNTLSFTAYAGQTYYAVLRSSNISFTSLNARLVFWFPNGSNWTDLTDTLVGFNPLSNPLCNLNNFNYAQLADSNFLRLPISSNLWGENPTYYEDLVQIQISNVPIGYDTNGVSTDLTDYVGYIPNCNSNGLNPKAGVRVDPMSGYFFQVLSPYLPADQSYFYPGSSNAILASNNQAPYTPSNVPFRQTKIVHWYTTAYLPDPVGSPITYTPADIASTIPPYTSNTTNGTLLNYGYDNTSGEIQFGLGICGFAFTPGDGIWTVDKLFFRSAIFQNDPNDLIKHIGIFPTNQANTPAFSEIALSNALFKLDFVKKVVYPASLNFGFDAQAGTYYEFVTDTSFGSNTLNGFDQNAQTLVNNPQSYYSAIAYDINSNIVYMHALAGSPTPYPYVSDASAAVFYFDGESAPNNRGIVMPLPPTGPNSNAYPPSGISYTLSQYEQSTPIGTNITNFLGQTDIAEDSNAFYPWSNVGYSPSAIYASVANWFMTLDTEFKIYTYSNTSNRQFSYQYSLTIDTIFPPAETTTFVAAAGNNTAFAFLGFKLVAGVYQIRIKMYNPNTGLLYDLGVPATYTISDLAFSIRSFSITDANGIIISGSSGTGTAVTYRTPNLSTPFFTDTYGGSYVTAKAVQDPVSPTIYILPLLGTGQSSGVYFGQSETASSASRETYTFSGVNVPSYLTDILVTRIPGSVDELLFLSSDPLTANRFLKVKTITGVSPNFSATLLRSIFIFRNTVGDPMPALSFTGGALGSKWSYFAQNPTIYGNRNDTVDAPIKIQNAWQLFYPAHKIVLRKLANEFSPITDLSGLEYPEYPHTNMFAYTSLAKMYSDISGKWGLESSGNFLVSDVNFNGYYFNSYIYNVPLLPQSNPSDFTYLAIRNYSPSEKSQVLVRFNMPQRYDFGFVRFTDISNEAFQLNDTSYNPVYALVLSNFNTQFVFGVGSNPFYGVSNVPPRNFGYNPTQNINGSNITARGFGDFLRQYRALFALYNSNVQVINTITSNVNSNMFQFIRDNLIYILPEFALTRQGFTEPITFSILWRSSLTPLYLAAEDEWGLGWNLGYPKIDTPYSTIQRATSFFKILDDYIYLKLNEPYDMNRMDFGAKENLTITNEPTGQIRTYNGKLLLNTFGSYAQTIIQNPVYFNPPILKLDKLTFQWFDVVGQIINNAECEWNAAIQIVEEMPVSQIRGKNPVIIPR